MNMFKGPFWVEAQQPLFVACKGADCTTCGLHRSLKIKDQVRDRAKKRHWLWVLVQKYLLTEWIAKVRSLRCWNDETSGSKVIVDSYAAITTSKALGYWNYSPNKYAIIYPTGELHCDVSTIIHELAHAATPNEIEHHGPQWTATYLKAVAEFLTMFCRGEEVSMKAWARNNYSWAREISYAVMSTDRLVEMKLRGSLYDVCI